MKALKLLLAILTIGCLVGFLSFRRSQLVPGELHLMVGLPSSPWLTIDRTAESSTMHVELFSLSWLCLGGVVALFIIRRNLARKTRT